MTDTSPFSGLVQLWLSKIQMAWDQKNRRFGIDAREGLFFYKGPYDNMYLGGFGGPSQGLYGRARNTPVSSVQPPAIMMTLNKVAELVQLFGPVLYYKNPNRKASARKQVETTTDLFVASIAAYPQYEPLMTELLMMSQQQNASDQTTAVLVESLLNATPNPLGLKDESRRAIDECLIMGMGLLYTQVFTPPGSATKVVGSFFDSCLNLLIDPDARDLNHAMWTARRWIQPVWEAERKFGLPPGSLKGNLESNNMQGEVAGMGWDGKLMQSQNRTCDTIIYYEIWSKTGLGSRLKGANDQFTQAATEGIIGDFARIVVAPGTEYPLNAPPSLMAMEGTPENMQLVTQAFEWETPFFVDGGWPFTPLVFHDVPQEPWPASHISFAMGELKAMNWLGSWALGKVKNNCRDFIAVKKRLSDEFKQLVANGPDMTMLEVTEEYKTVREAVEFLQQNNMNTDLFKVLELLEHWFDQRTGLTELMYGMSSRQYRSAAEAEIKESNANVRPDDMANKVEDWQTNIARREAFASQWHLQGQDVVPFLGKPGGALWQLLIAQQDPAKVLYDIQYRVEAGSIRKPNRSRDAENATALMQQVLPIFVQYAQATGDVSGVNKILTTWAKSMDIDPSEVQLPMMMPPPTVSPPNPNQPAVAA